MKRSLTLLLSLVLLCGATSMPLALEHSLIDRVAVVAKVGAPAASAALLILENITFGRITDADLEVKVGLTPGQLRSPNFQLPSVRAYALRRIGESNLPEAMEFLQGITPDDVGSEACCTALRSALQIAVRQAQFNRLPDELAKIRFLEDTTSERSAANWWAADELCERGSYRSLPFVTAVIRRSYSLPQDIKPEEVFCEGRMSIIANQPDRIRALGSFLTSKHLTVGQNVSNDRRLIQWAIDRLHQMKSPRADAELQRYQKEIEAELEKLPESADRHQEFLLSIRRSLDQSPWVPRRK